jgi:Tfp pilus assembly protein PilF
LADTYVAVGDIEKAEYYWLKTIEKTKSNALRVMNLRGYGIFLFHNEKIELGRQKFDEAQRIELPVNDENRVMKIDTCLMLCDLEIEFGSKENYEVCLIKAMEILATMTSERRKDEMHKRLRQKLPNNIKPTNKS